MIVVESGTLFDRARADHDEYLMPLASLVGPLRDRGIRFEPGRGDVALADAREVAPPIDRPTVIVDRTDGGFLWWRFGPGEGQTRQLLNDPMVLGLLKVSRYRTLAAYDSPPTDRAYHSRLIHGQHAGAVPLGDERVATALSADGYRKIRLVPGFWAFEHCSALAETAIDFDASRPLDVFCAGTVDYGCPAIAWHRRQAFALLGSIRGARVMLGRGRVFPVPTYHRLLREAKICVSPWGYGETSYRDYEALLAGSILIKPRTDFIDSLLPLDEGRHYFACRPDFADLPDLVGSVLARWPALAERRRECREYVIQGRQPDWLADRVADELIAVIDATAGSTSATMRAGS